MVRAIAYVATAVTFVILLGLNAAAQTADGYSNHTSTVRHVVATPPVPVLHQSPGSHISVVLPKLSRATVTYEFVFVKPKVDIDNDYWASLLDYSTLPDDDAARTFITRYSSAAHRRVLATQLSYCPLTPLCTFGLDNSTYDSYRSCCLSCSCDHTCVANGNCCPDAKADIQQFFEFDVRRSCIPLHLRKDDTLSQFASSAYGIAECPDTSANMNEDSQKCVQDYPDGDVSLTDVLPVWHNESNRLYRNIHCALCNGVSSKELDFFKPEIGCYTSPPGTLETISELLQYVLEGNTNCDIGFKLGFADTESCKWGISKCNMTGRWVKFDLDYEEACNMYTSVATVGGTRFKNVFCALCNGFTIRQRSCPRYDTPALPYSFSGLLAVSPPDNIHNRAVDKKCDSGFIYHQSTGECLRARCSPQRYLVDGECVEVAKQWERFNYATSLSLTPATSHTIAEALRIVGHVVMVLKDSLGKLLVDNPEHDMTICDTDIILKSDVSCDQIYSHDLRESNLMQFLVRVNFSIMVKHRREDVVTALMNTMRLDIISDIAGMENETMMAHLVNGYEHDFNQGRHKLENIPDIQKSKQIPHNGAVKMNSFCSTFDYQAVIPLLPPKALLDNCYYRQEHVPVLSLLPCPMIGISNDPLIVNDDGVLFTEADMMFNHTQFYISDNETVFLCKDPYFKLKSKRIAPESSLSVEQIVSIACSSLSILLLLITLLTFAILSQLRTLPGKNNIALVVALLLAQVLYLVGSFSGLEQDSFACKLVGILTHFFWLLVLFWMNVCTFHMMRTMTKTKVVFRGTGRKKYLLYHLYCFTAAAAFVGINVLVSSMTSGNEDIGYGVNSCYVSSQEMLVYTFGIPLAVVVVSNIGMFVVVIVTIKKSSAVQKNVQNERNDIAVFARLSTLTGATWIFGFFYMWTRVPALSYIFIVLNASQGVFLFVSFICTRRVVKIAGQKYSALSRAEKSSQKRTRLTDMRS